MGSTQADATNEAIEAAEGGAADQFLDRLADRVGGRATVKAVFGEPIRQGDLIVIPVARIRWGVGGGVGSSGEPGAGPGWGAGTGGGGGVTADPVGYLEIRDGAAVFEPIHSSQPSPLLVLASGLAAAFVLRALARGIRR